MRVGLFSWTIRGGSVDSLIDEVIQAEVAGFHSYWAPQVMGHDAVTLLAAAAGRTTRIELGTAVVPIQPRHPLVLAQQAATASALAGGRLCLGIGLSHRDVIESMYGLDFSNGTARMREYLEVLVAARDDARIDHDGALYRCRTRLPIAEALPFPILVAALGPKLLGLAGRLADGTITWATGPKTLQSHTVPTISRAAEGAGRQAPRIVAGLPVCVTSDPTRVRQSLGEELALYRRLPSYRAMLDREGAVGPEDIALVGSLDEVHNQLGRLGDIGVTDLAAVVVGDLDERHRTTELLLSH